MTALPQRIRLVEPATKPKRTTTQVVRCCRIVGDRNAGILASYILSWSRKAKPKRGLQGKWNLNPRASILAATGLSWKQYRRARRILIDDQWAEITVHWLGGKEMIATRPADAFVSAYNGVPISEKGHSTGHAEGTHGALTGHPEGTLFTPSVLSSFSPRRAAPQGSKARREESSPPLTRDSAALSGGRAGGAPPAQDKEEQGQARVALERDLARVLQYRAECFHNDPDPLTDPSERYRDAIPAIIESLARAMGVQSTSLSRKIVNEAGPAAAIAAIDRINCGDVADPRAYVASLLNGAAKHTPAELRASAERLGIPRRE